MIIIDQHLYYDGAINSNVDDVRNDGLFGRMVVSWLLENICFF
jgi:hypothetical protein